MASPRATPATGALIGTPASIRQSVPPQTVAIEDDPFDSRMSDTTRTVYGKDSSSGMTAWMLRSARCPWPISRLPGPLMGFTSPTLKEGKL
ncbi:MAG: hypothetical protein BWX47_01962 [candidate division Hyd24-12 bacterium ADurb.Bin004]|nr:MAG: hypothetical protein BWX47_01962 [candidate division Hyd24-12 bacterium ADurb.Bin004]